MDKAWDPIYRCLTGDLLDELDDNAGEPPLKYAVLGEPLLREFYVGHRSARLVYGEWVDEAAPAAPLSPTG